MPVQSSAITDAGLAHLHGMTKLERLGLRGARVDDDGLERLGDFRRLQWIDLANSRVTKDGLAGLRAGHPGLKTTRRLPIDR